MPTVKIHEQQKEWAVKAAAGFVTFMLCYGVMFHGISQDIAAARQSIRDSQKRHELYLQVQTLKERLDRREGVLLTKADQSQLIYEIAGAADRAKIVETEGQPSNPVKEGDYHKLKMEMTGSGTFFSLLQFLQEIERILPSVKSRNVTAQFQKEKKGSLFLNVVLETLFKK